MKDSILDQAIDFTTKAIDTTKHNVEATQSASLKFLEDTYHNPEKRLRQVAAVGEGVVVGGIKQIPDQLVNHTGDTLKTVATGVGVGMAIGLLPLELPVVAIGLGAVGAVAVCGYAWDLGQRIGHNKELHRALDKVWETGDQKVLDKLALPVIEKSLGKESFDFALATVSGDKGFKLGKVARQIKLPHVEFPALFPQMRPCMETIPVGRLPNMGSGMEGRTANYYAMSGRGGFGRTPETPLTKSTESLTKTIADLSKKSVDELVGGDDLLNVQSELIRLSKSGNEIDVQAAKNLKKVNDQLDELIKPIRKDVKENNKAFEEGTLADEAWEAHADKAELLVNLIEQRAKALGWDGKSKGMRDHVENATSKQDGFQVQARVIDAAAEIFNRKPGERGRVMIDEMVNQGFSESEARLRLNNLHAMPSQTMADMVGGDLLVFNKLTGDIYPIDITTNAINMRSTSIVESLGTYPRLEFKNKDHAAHRRQYLIGAIGGEPYASKLDGMELAELKALEQAQLEVIFGRMFSKESILNLLDESLPITGKYQHPTLKLFELWKFSEQLEKRGLSDWAKAARKSMESVWKICGKGIIPRDWYNTIFIINK